MVSNFYPWMKSDERAQFIARETTKHKLVPSAGAWAWSTSGHATHNGVSFNEDTINKPDIQSRMRLGVTSGFHPPGCDTFKSIADHVYGHQLDNLVGARHNPEIKLMFARTGGADVSRYAKENIDEFIAEAWAESLNNPNPRPTAKRVAEIIRSKYDVLFSSRPATRRRAA